MKPDAPLEVRGPFKAISTSCGNYQLSEILPKHAAISEHLAGAKLPSYRSRGS